MALIMKIDDLKRELHRLIEECNYFLQDSRVIKLSQKLDKFIAIFQGKYRACSYNRDLA